MSPENFSKNQKNMNEKKPHVKLGLEDLQRALDEKEIRLPETLNPENSNQNSKTVSSEFKGVGAKQIQEIPQSRSLNDMATKLTAETVGMSEEELSRDLKILEDQNETRNVIRTWKGERKGDAYNKALQNRHNAEKTFNAFIKNSEPAYKEKKSNSVKLIPEDKSQEDFMELNNFEVVGAKRSRENHSEKNVKTKKQKTLLWDGKNTRSTQPGRDIPYEDYVDNYNPLKPKETNQGKEVVSKKSEIENAEQDARQKFREMNFLKKDEEAVKNGVYAAAYEQWQESVKKVTALDTANNPKEKNSITSIENTTDESSPIVYFDGAGKKDFDKKESKQASKDIKNILGNPIEKNDPEKKYVEKTPAIENNSEVKKTPELDPHSILKSIAWMSSKNSEFTSPSMLRREESKLRDAIAAGSIDRLEAELLLQEARKGKVAKTVKMLDGRLSNFKDNNKDKKWYKAFEKSKGIYQGVIGANHKNPFLKYGQRIAVYGTIGAMTGGAGFLIAGGYVGARIIGSAIAGATAGSLYRSLTKKSLNQKEDRFTDLYKKDWEQQLAEGIQTQHPNREAVSIDARDRDRLKRLRQAKQEGALSEKGLAILVSLEAARKKRAIDLLIFRTRARANYKELVNKAREKNARNSMIAAGIAGLAVGVGSGIALSNFSESASAEIPKSGNIDEVTTETEKLSPDEKIKTTPKPPIEATPQISKDIFIHSAETSPLGVDEGITHSFERQINASPELRSALGIAGESITKSELADVAEKFGYISTDGSEVRVFAQQGAGYELQMDGDNVKVVEYKGGHIKGEHYVDGSRSDIQGEHNIGDDFEGKNIEKKYEYIEGQTRYTPDTILNNPIEDTADVDPYIEMHRDKGIFSNSKIAGRDSWPGGAGYLMTGTQLGGDFPNVIVEETTFNLFAKNGIALNEENFKKMGFRYAPGDQYKKSFMNILDNDPNRRYDWRDIYEKTNFEELKKNVDFSKNVSAAYAEPGTLLQSMESGLGFESNISSSVNTELFKSKAYDVLSKNGDIEIVKNTNGVYALRMEWPSGIADESVKQNLKNFESAFDLNTPNTDHLSYEINNPRTANTRVELHAISERNALRIIQTIKAFK